MIVRWRLGAHRVLIVAYGLMALAGVAAMVWPAPSVRASSGTAGAIMWSVLLLIGGVFACIGRLSGRWLGEYVGLPLIAGMFTVYGLALAYVASASQPAIAGALFFGSVACLFAARWHEVAAVRREAVRHRNRRGDP